MRLGKTPCIHNNMEHRSIAADTAAFPASLAGTYESLSCLAWNGGTVTWLCRRRADDTLVIVRIADDDEAVRRLRNEEEILRRIAASDDPAARLFPLPLVTEDLEEPHILAFIRSHIAGRSLEALTETPGMRPGLPQEKALKYIADVLEQLAFLHGLKPPVIHRDIKPQNIIVDTQDRCRLVDMDIARVQREDGDADTLVMGTRLTAPPEQYGYRATDARSDVYSAGVLLRYCLTGEYSGADDTGLPPALQRVIRKATRFDPQDRYPNARAFLADVTALQNRDGNIHRRRRAITALACAVMLAGTFLLGRLTASLPVPAPAFDGGESLTVTEDMFDGDTELYEAFLRGEYAECAAVILPDGMHFARYIPFLHRLETMAFPERKPLSASELHSVIGALRKSPCWQSSVPILFAGLDIESLEPFRTKYVGDHFALEFHHCTLPADPSPLQAIVPYLSDLCCSDHTSVSWDNLDFLNTSNHLNILDIRFDGSADTNLSALAGLRSPTVLRLWNASAGPDTLDAIGRMHDLEVLWLINCGITDVTALGGLEKLTELDLTRNLITDLSPVKCLPRLEALTADWNPLPADQTGL